MTALPTLIAELEEALKAATPEPWIVSSQNKKDVEGGPHSDHNGFRHLVSDSYTGLDDVDEANARLIALMRNSLPTLIEALKRQGEALGEIIALDHHNMMPESQATKLARAALKETPDV